MESKRRAAYLASFGTFVQHSPFTYHVFVYRKSEFRDRASLGARMRRDLVEFLFDHIERLQGFDLVKIYYDDGQALVTRALHDGFEYALAREAVIYRDARPDGYRMLQVADYACGVELAALRYGSSASTCCRGRACGGSVLLARGVSDGFWTDRCLSDAFWLDGRLI